MLEPEPGLFIFDYPVFLVLATKLKKQPEFVSLLSGEFVIPTSHAQGKKMLAVFTDHDLAERFAAAAQIPDAVAVQIRSAEDLTDILLQAKVLNCDLVAFDPAGDAPSKQIHSIEEALDAIRPRRE